MYDAAVIGGGPAGLTAATWLARYRFSTLIVDSGEQRNRWVERVHGYFGEDPADPRALLERTQEALSGYAEVERCAGTATDVTGSIVEGFELTLDSGRTIGARQLVLATGVRDEFPDVENFFEHYGASVFHCPTCDGYEAKGKRVVALGWDGKVPGFAMELLNWAASVTVVTDGRSFEADAEHRQRLKDAGIDVLERSARELAGERGALEGLRLDDGTLIPCEMAFFSIAHHPRIELARRLGCDITNEGYVAVDLCCMTSVEGVYAAGDVTPGEQLVQVAAGEGAVAGVACAESLRVERQRTDIT